MNKTHTNITKASRAGLRRLGTLVALAATMTATTVDAYAQQAPGRACELGEDCPLQVPSTIPQDDPEGTGNPRSFGPERVPEAVFNRPRTVPNSPNVVIDPAEATGFTGVVVTVGGVRLGDPENAEGNGKDTGALVERALTSPAAAERFAGPANPHVAADPGSEPTATGSEDLDAAIADVVETLVAQGVLFETGDVVTLGDLANYAQNSELLAAIHSGEVDRDLELELEIKPGATGRVIPDATGTLEREVVLRVTTPDGGEAWLRPGSREGSTQAFGRTVSAPELAPDSGFAPVPEGLASGNVRAVAAELVAGIVRPAFAPVTVAGAAPSELGASLRETLRDPQTATQAPTATAPPRPEPGQASIPAAEALGALQVGEATSQPKAGTVAQQLRRLIASCASRGPDCPTE